MKLQSLFITLLLGMTSCSGKKTTSPKLDHDKSPVTTAAFRLQHERQLKKAIKACIETSPIGDCSEGPHGPIGDWDVSAIDEMMAMFSGASAFNQDLSKWDMSAAIDTGFMFYRASGFNQDLSMWDVSKVTGMGFMFYGAIAFNQDLSMWDVSKVTDMRSMFYGASAFNQDLSKWDVSIVNYMSSMFYLASAFNQDLSKWDVSDVIDMASMFRDASAFKRELCGDAWVNSIADKSDMFIGSPGSIPLKSSLCETAKPAFTPESTEELQDAISCKKQRNKNSLW